MNKRNCKEYSGFVLGMDENRKDMKYCVYFPMNNHFYYYNSLESVKNIYPFNENLYIEKRKENSKVYTILYAIKENGSDIGYYIGNNIGEVSFYFKQEAIDLFDKVPFMNYKKVKKGKKFSLYRNRTDNVEYIDIHDFTQLIGYDVREFILNRSMDISELQSKLLKFEFKCGASIPFKHKINNEIDDCTQFIWYNKKGFVIVLNYSNLYKLGNFKNFYICMRRVNYDKYHKFLRYNNFMIQSSENFEENKYIFIGKNILNIINFSNIMDTFSKSIIPFELYKNNYYEFLFLTSEEKQYLKEKINNVYFKNQEIYLKLGIILFGFKNIDKYYDENLKYLYSNFIENENNIINTFKEEFNIAEDTLSVLKLWVNEFFGDI